MPAMRFETNCYCCPGRHRLCTIAVVAEAVVASAVVVDRMVVSAAIAVELMAVEVAVVVAVADSVHWPYLSTSAVDTGSLDRLAADYLSNRSLHLALAAEMTLLPRILNNYRSIGLFLI